MFVFVCVCFFFFAQIVWHASTFWEDAAQRINKQKLHRKLPLYAMNKLNRWHYCLLWEGSIGGYPIPQYRKKNWQIPCQKVWILYKILRKTSLTINTFSLAITLNEYCKCDTLMLITAVRVFLFTNATNIPFGWNKQTKKCGEKRVKS